MAPKRKPATTKAPEAKKKKNGGASSTTTPHCPNTAKGRLRSRSTAPARTPTPAPSPVPAPVPTPTPQHDTNRFVSDWAEKACKLIKEKSKQVLPERGLDPGKKYPSISAIIKDRKWLEFVKHPKPGVLAVVREFYANARDTERGKSWVRGVQVSYSAEDINAYFKLQNYPDFQFDAFLKKIDDTKIVKALCIDGAAFNEEKYLSAQPMFKEAKAWINFVSSRLLPTTTISSFSRDRCAVAYAILQPKIEIDVGKIMSHEIYRSCHASEFKYSMYFPSLITELCRGAGVQISDMEEKCRKKHVIDCSIIDSYNEPSLDGAKKSAVQKPIKSQLSIREELGMLRKEVVEMKKDFGQEFAEVKNSIKVVVESFKFVAEKMGYPLPDMNITNVENVDSDTNGAPPEAVEAEEESDEEAEEESDEEAEDELEEAEENDGDDDVEDDANDEGDSEEEDEAEDEEDD